MNKLLSILLILVAGSSKLLAQSTDDLEKEIERLQSQVSNLRYSFNSVSKKIDDLLWYDKVGDLAFIDKVYLTGPPKSQQQQKNKTAQGYNNPLRFWSYIFIPKDIDPSKKYPLLVFPHGGVHSNFNTYYTHIIRELMAQQYIVIAAEYRGSTGYGFGFL